MSVVDPVAVTANCLSKLRLGLSNVLGQNAAAIAACEEEYQWMWAQNAAAMMAYRVAVSAATSKVSPWLQAPGPTSSVLYNRHTGKFNHVQLE